MFYITSRGQGAIEYLLIIGAAILIVAVVILALTGTFNMGKSNAATSNDNYSTNFDNLRTKVGGNQTTPTPSVPTTTILLNGYAYPTTDGLLIDLVGLWHLDGDYSDSSGNVITGTCSTCPGVVTSRFGQGMSFDNINGQGINLAGLDVNIINGAKNTVSFWMNWDGYEGVMPFGWTTYDLWISGGCFGFNTEQGDIYGFSNSGLKDNWTHVVAVFYNGTPDNTNNEIWINGTKKTLSKCLTYNSVSKSVTLNAVISGWVNNPLYKFSGTID